MAIENYEKSPVLTTPLSFEAPRHEIIYEYPREPYKSECRVPGLHFTTDSMRLSSFKFPWWAPKDASFVQ